ncbi:hypothetical protein GCM10009836_01950 [Pseudonocardia ailaonensis]|uniref:HTH tetR-type domain-containing protein n=1 Tax=Pseudonocardia ailaonensis TaxID=367279 RepID=A0ABN2MIN2_9PSEU
MNGEDTRREISRVARSLFATHGYAGTTTRMISLEVGVTPAALHHYFGRKPNLALAVWHATTDIEYARLESAMEAAEGFIDKLHALLGSALQALASDPDSTRFIFSIREDARRTPELAEIVEDNRLAVLVRKLVDFGVETGVVEKGRSADARGAIGAVLLGITAMGPDVSAGRIDQMATGCRLLVEGALFHPDARGSLN